MRPTPTRFRPLLLALGMSLGGTVQAIVNPIPLSTTSFNADVVVENGATPVLQLVTTASVDKGTNNTDATWMEAGYDPDNPGNGLPLPGTEFTAISNAGYTFRMPPSYTAPNGILIDTAITNGSFTLTTPAPYALLSFLSSGGVGGNIVGVTVHHQDGTIETGSFGSPDWFFGVSNVAFIARERVGSTTAFTYANANEENPRLYFRDLPLTNTTSPVTNIDFIYLSGQSASHSVLFAVSGATIPGGPVGPIEVTGYTHDFVVEKEAARPGRVVSTNLVDGTNVWATTQTPMGTANDSWTFYERGFNLNNPDGNGFAPNPAAANTGLPPAGSTVTNAGGDHAFALPPDYSAHNACHLSPMVPGHALTPVSPSAASVLSLLATAGDVPAMVEVVVQHQDGGSQTNQLLIAGWSDPLVNRVLGASGQVDVTSGRFSSATLNPGGDGFPLLHHTDFVITNAASPVTNLVLTRLGGGAVAIFAVSGTLDPIAPVMVTHPESRKANVGDEVQFTALAVANQPLTYQWQKGTGGVFADLTDGVNISGTTSTQLSLASVDDLDESDYRCLISNVVGDATSATATLTVLSALPDVTSAGDFVAVYHPDGGSFPGGEAPPNAIDDTTTKYLNFGDGVTPMSVPVGFVVVPSTGRTIVSAMRLYTANDAPERDPADFILEGSNDGGQSHTIIHSNLIEMPDGRNDAGFSLDPLNQHILQIRIENTNSYTSYRWHTTRVKGLTSLMQIGEVELLGLVDTSNPAPFFSLHPGSTVVYDQSSAGLSVIAGGGPPPDLHWQRRTNGVFAEMIDGGNMAGAQSAFLSLNPVNFVDAGDYRCVASNATGAVTSLVSRLTVLTTNLDVTQPGDLVTAVGDASMGFWDNADPSQAIDDFNILIYQNGGSGLNAAAGFGPWEGPAGVVVTPSARRTKVTGLRIYTAEDLPVRDPVDYLLEGSNNGGATYTLIASGPLSLPDARANTELVFDPTVQPMQEILFDNNAEYHSYRLTFTDLKDANPPAGDIVCLQIGDIELLGVVTGPAQPVLSIEPNGFGGYTIGSTSPGASIYSATNLSGTIQWEFEGVAPVNVSPSLQDPARFYQVRP